MRIHQPTLLLATLFCLGATAQDDTSTRGPSQEPPLRARVTIGGEQVEVTLGSPGRTADGREVLVELLATRVFEAEGSFRFTYPRDWKFLGVAQSPYGGWWNLNSDGKAVHMRRHDQDADEILEQYVSGLESTGKAERVAVGIDLDGRHLDGFAVEYDVGSIGRGGQSRRWVQECYAWSESEGVSWLLTLQRAIGPVPGSLESYLTATEFILDADGNLVVAEAQSAAELPQPSLLTDFRWE